MSYENIKLFAITDNNDKPLYYGHTKINLSSKLAEMKYLYKLNRNCNKFKSVFDKYGIDNIRIGLVDVISLNDIDEINKTVKELTHKNIHDYQIQPNEPIHIQTAEPQPLIDYINIKKTREPQPHINPNKPKRTFVFA